MERSQQFCTFLLDGKVFGTPLVQVREVLPNQFLTRVPLANEAIAGIMNLRGQIVPVIDVRRRLGMAERTAEQPSMNVVVAHPAGEVSLLVDEIGDVLDLDPAGFELLPETVDAAMRQMLSGVHKLENSLLHVLNTASICSICNG